MCLQLLPPALSTGLPALDAVLGGGIEPATLTIMGGLQESGKTELALHIAEHIAMEQLRAWQVHQRGACPCVLFFEFEMKAEQLSARTAARLGGIARADIRKGRMTERVTTAFRELEKIGELLPIKFEARSPATLGRFRTAFRTLLRQRKVALVIVDNITRMADAAAIKDMGQAYSAVLNELDNAAKTTDVPVLALAHVLKSASGREDGRPRADDMPFNTGRYPDKAFIVHRPEKMIAPAPPERGAMKEEAWQAKVEQWHKRRAETVNVTEIIPAKLREDDGERRPEMIRLRFDREAGRFVDPLIAAEPPADLWGET